MKRSIRLPILAATVFALVAGLFVTMTTQARAAGDLTLYVNSNAPGFPAASTTPAALAAMCPLGDAGNVYPPSGSANTCTLGAALTIANANSTAADPYTVTLADGFAADAPAGGWVITPTAITQAMLAITAANTVTLLNNANRNGAYYVISSPMTVDLQNNLGIVVPSTLSVSGAAIYITGTTGPKELLNASNIINYHSSYAAAIVVGANASNVRIDGGQTVPETSNNFHAFLNINNGATDVTFANYTVGNLHQGVSSGCQSVAVCFSPGSTAYNSTREDTPNTSNPAERVTIENVTFTSTGGAYHAIVLYQSSKVIGLTITGNTFENLVWTDTALTTNATVLDMWTNSGYKAILEGLDFSDNTVVNSSTLPGTNQNSSFIKLPAVPLGGVNYIRNNTFVASSAAHAIGWTGSGGTGTKPSNLYIQNNTFDGFTASAIYLDGTGVVTVERNLMLAETYSNANTTTEETGGTTAAMYTNAGANANQKIATWYPVATPAAPEVTADCTAAFYVARPTSGTVPTTPLRIDVYYTATNKAEKLLGSVDISGATTPQKISVPVVGLANLSTGEVSGNLRVQTQSVGASPVQLESSQYSRTLAFEGNCAPKLTINQAEGMDDPSLARDLRFTLFSTAPLDPASVTLDDFVLTATPVSETIDASRINARILSITPSADNMTFDVVVRADDSVKVTVEVPAGAVTSALGWTNQDPAAHTDNEITFINPLRVAPQKLILLTGEPTGKDFTISIADGAPTPTAELSFTTTVEQPAGNSTVTLSDENPTLPAGAIGETTVTAKASAGTVTAGTAGKIVLTVTSEDPNYDGLVLSDVIPRLFAVDPLLAVEKRAYVDGVEMPYDAPLVAGEEICFKYTVINTSTSEWTTTLRDIKVRDTDIRLGDGGLIGTIDELPAGASEILDGGCVALDARDTTEGNRP